MSAFDCWQLQREPLRVELSKADDLPDAVYAVRHALLQTEQNAMSEIADDELRQQAGVLFGCVKSAAGLADAGAVAKVWEAQKTREAKPRAGVRTLWLIALGAQAALALLCYLKGDWLLTALCLGALALACCAAFSRRKAPAPARDEALRVTVRPDADRLLALLDAQMRAVDRYINDLAYLNERLRGDGQGADARSLGRFADLMEALYECDPEERAPAEEAAKRLMESAKLRALDYSADASRLFTALPSKTETRTLSPAIVSLEDGRLLRRGTAAVRMEVA